MAVWSSGMILAQGARGPAFNSQNGPVQMNISWNIGGLLTLYSSRKHDSLHKYSILTCFEHVQKDTPLTIPKAKACTDTCNNTSDDHSTCSAVNRLRYQRPGLASRKADRRWYATEKTYLSDGPTENISDETAP